MRRTDLGTFRAVLRTKQADRSVKSGKLESVAIERSPEMIEELQYKSDMELAIVCLNRDSAIRLHIELALIRISDDSCRVCVYCEQEIGRRRLEAVPWTPFCVRCQEAAHRGDQSVPESIEPMFLEAA